MAYSQLPMGGWMDNYSGEIISDEQYQALMYPPTTSTAPATWTPSGTGLTWGDVEDPLTWTNSQTGATSSYDPSADSNWWRDWYTPEVTQQAYGQGIESAIAPEVIQAGYTNTPLAGKTYQDLLQDVSQLPATHQASTLLEMHRKGWIQQLPGFDQTHWSTLQPQLDGIMHDFNSGTSGPMEMLEGALIHGGNMLEDAFANPLNPDPLTSSWTGGEASDFLGRPSESTYQEQADAGVDVTTSQMLNNFGSTVGLMAAGAGLSNLLPNAGAGDYSMAGGGEVGSGYPSSAQGWWDQSAISGTGGLEGELWSQPQWQAPMDSGLNEAAFYQNTQPLTQTQAVPPVDSGVSNSGMNWSSGNYAGGGDQFANEALWYNSQPLNSQVSAQPPIDSGVGGGPFESSISSAATGATGTAATAAAATAGAEAVDTSWPDDSVPGGANGGEIPNVNNASGDVSGFDWNSIPEQFRTQIQNLLAPQGGMNWLGLGTDLINLSGQRTYQQGLLDTMNRAVDYSDPFRAQRPAYQQQFNQMNSDPNWMQNDSVLQGMMQQGLRQTAAQNAAKGYMGSGNMLHDLTRTATETAGNYAIPRMQQVGQAAGAFDGSGQAGQIAGTLGNLAGQAGMQQNQTLGNMIGRIPQTMQNGVNSAIGNGLSSAWNGLWSL